MKYRSKIAENRVCEIFNSVLKKQTEQACDWKEWKAIRFEKLQSNKAVLKRIIHLDTN